MKIHNNSDRCRALSQKILCRVDDALAQRLHNEIAEGMLLAGFEDGLTGTPC